ncbi:uncharacterized protein E0L32_002971 [Thyridium curvatum]|uniref:Terpene synthase n=1 Tax=Thyridium curvatum TaxID=1093900 RepID=A0A507BMB8_9PEZI|nr:uncharacterized protein E0L32_002971 [Thyridium curvatum]TPX17870.1 hypothetical protein E0L32_002971 [Thyridium curvatum]
MAPSAMITPPPSRSGASPDNAYFEHAAQNGDKLKEYADGHWIRLPEALFSSIMSVEPAVNPLHSTSKALSDEWLRNALRMDDKTASIWSKLDIAYMSAICAPNADVETLKLMNDWNGWVFAFDDPFDEGNFANNPIKAAEEVIHTLSMLDGVHPVVTPDENPLRHTLQSCWMRFRERAPPGLQYRWKRHLTLYCIGVLQQVAVQHRASRPTVEDYMDMRAGCVGAYPCIGLMQQNDLCSYRKDLIKGEDSNVIFILKDQGMTDQEAVDHIGEMLYECYRRWYEALRSLPFWGEKIDRDVVKFINGCRNIALGNLHWSIHEGKGGTTAVSNVHYREFSILFQDSKFGTVLFRSFLENAAPKCRAKLFQALKEQEAHIPGMSQAPWRPEDHHIPGWTCVDTQGARR